MNTINRNTNSQLSYITIILTLLFISLFYPNAIAQNYPNKPIKIIIPFPAGDPIDVITRMIAPKLTETLGQSIIVENIAGGSGSIGITALTKATADGYTISAVQTGNLIVLPQTLKSVKYNTLKDIAPIALVLKNYQGIAATTNAPFNNLKEMVAYAKANPGKLSLATNGEGGYPHLTFEDFRMRANFTYLHIPYKGSVQLSTDLIGGQVQVGILGFASFIPHIRSGKLKLLGISSSVKVSSWPDAQLTSEVVPGFSAEGWFGYGAPGGTSPEVIKLLNQAINQAFTDKAIINKLSELNLMVESQSPAYFEEVILNDFSRYAGIVKASGLQPQ